MLSSYPVDSKIFCAPKQSHHMQLLGLACTGSTPDISRLSYTNTTRLHDFPLTPRLGFVACLS